MQRWSESSFDIRALRKIVRDGPLSVAPESRAIIQASSLSVTTTKEDDGWLDPAGKKRKSMNESRDDISSALVLAAGAFQRAGAVPQTAGIPWHRVGRGIRPGSDHRLGGKLSGNVCLIGLAGAVRLQDAHALDRLEADHVLDPCSDTQTSTHGTKAISRHCVAAVTFRSHGLSGSLPLPRIKRTGRPSPKLDPVKTTICRYL